MDTRDANTPMNLENGGKFLFSIKKVLVYLLFLLDPWHLQIPLLI